ncbi:hypothetical protein OVA24_02960 [Luteolibacter sp. SL250]|uniref:hypothetical protein n=1 Tax=Luteolibacter sp. SL250 TaxID=2995170 RepID=UPI0022707783|nr:hypothetical protein [Luteolibacter sp. SL250]WAC20337.1 hypothetical protein OVA24_02960 [Luteolibacter sp. SL250]
MKSFIPALACLGLVFPCSSHAEEILFHAGPTVAVPDAVMLDPTLKADPKGDDLQFIYEFFIGSELLARLPHASGMPPLSAAKAIELASASVEPKPESGGLPVRKLDLMEDNKAGKRISYYLITLKVDDNAESHRVVLMDGTVLKPKLRRIDGK